MWKYICMIQDLLAIWSLIEKLNAWKPIIDEKYIWDGLAY